MASSSIIIVNYKSERRTLHFVKKELSKLVDDYQVVIVNNAATEESNIFLQQSLSAELVHNVQQEVNSSNKVFVVASIENLGFAKGNNLGAQFAKRHLNSEYFLFSNNDILIQDSTTINQLVKRLNENNECGAIGPKIVGLDGIEQSPEPYYPFWKRHILRYLLSAFLNISQKRKIFHLDYPQKAKEGFHYKLMGSFFLMRSEDYFKCGMMDQNTFLYGEEVILSERLSKIGKRCYYLPTVNVVHEHGSTIRENTEMKKMREMQFENELYYYKRYRKVDALQIFIATTSLKLYNRLKR